MLIIILILKRDVQVGFEQSVAPAQTKRRTLARLNPRQLDLAFSGWVADLGERVRGVIAIDGKTLRGSKHSADGTGALHLVQAYAHEAGLMLASLMCIRLHEV